LTGIDPKPVAQLTGFPGWAANVELAEAQIAYRQRDFAAARSFLRQAEPEFSKPGAEPYQKHAVDALRAALAK
jgi:hypothetical protein